MKQRSIVFFILAFALLIAPAAYAQATRTWVSGVGDDANPCSRTAPCKTFAGAISKTAAGGEISVLDNGSFGAVTITKAITINGEGNLAGILSAGTNGIIVNAGVNDKIIIRNVGINGGGTGLNGIRFLAGKDLTVENVTIEGFTTRGIDMSIAGNGKLFVRNTKISEGGTGIFVTTSGASSQAQAMLDNVHLTGLTNGIEAATNGRITINRSVISGNASNGLLASGTFPRINANGCQISFNDVAGVNATSANAIIRLSDDDIVNNNAGITFVAGASIESTGNNRVAGNVSTTPPNATLIVQ
ncbi:MAG TPA: right-handed parallel beta-helix repeat-containing protein [Thermoanaerobaculia bacterium]|nr:right-handed parallel beta-helix repeat-containing protein [Thermoanaerobaculia bacterium]